MSIHIAHRYIIGALMVMSALFAYTLTTQAAPSSFDTGNCFCVSTDQSHTMFDCSDQTPVLDCTNKQTTDSICFSDITTPNECTTSENQSIIQTGTGTCECKIDGTVAHTAQSVSANVCADKKWELVGQNSGKKVTCSFALTGSSGQPNIPPPPPPPITVVTFNIQAGCTGPMDEGSYNIDNTIEQIKNINADVVLLQEVGAKGTKKGSCSSEHTQKDFIPDQTELSDYYFGRLLTLTKFKIVNTTGKAFKKQKGTTRNYTKVTLETPEKHQFIIFNAHLERFDIETRKKQIDELHALAKAETLPTIVTGDFNECSSYPLETFADGFLDAVKIDDYTFPTAAPTDPDTIKKLATSSGCVSPDATNIQERLDYVFASSNDWYVNGGLIVKEAGIASDHWPVAAQVQLATLAGPSGTPGTGGTGGTGTGGTAGAGGTGQDGAGIPPPLQPPPPPQKTFPTPQLSVPIPGLNFTKALGVGIEGASVTIPWLAQYLSAAYSFGIGVAIVISVIIILIGGIQHLSSAGSGSMISGAKEKITRGIIGLALALGSYLIITTINPLALSFKALSLEQVTGDFMAGAPPSADAAWANENPTAAATLDAGSTFPSAGTGGAGVGTGTGLANSQQFVKAYEELTNEAKPEKLNDKWAYKCLQFAHAMLKKVKAPKITNSNQIHSYLPVVKDTNGQNAWRGLTMEELSKQADQLHIGMVIHIKANWDRDPAYKPVENFHHWYTYMGKDDQGIPRFADSKRINWDGKSADQRIAGWMKAWYTKSQYAEMRQILGSETYPPGLTSKVYAVHNAF